MTINWDKLATEIRSQFEKEGLPMLVVVPSYTGDFDITTGKAGVTPNNYPTYGFITNFDLESSPEISPEEVKIIIHAGDPDNMIPNLSDKEGVKIIADGKKYSIKVPLPVRPAGTTLLYKIRAIEIKDEE